MYIFLLVFNPQLFTKKLCYDYTNTRSVELIMCSGINSGDCTLRIFFSSIKRDGD